MDLKVPSTLIIPPSAREEYEKRIVEWGEKGPAHNVGFRLTKPYTTIVVNARNMPINSAEQQKKRTFL